MELCKSYPIMRSFCIKLAITFSPHWVEQKIPTNKYRYKCKNYVIVCNYIRLTRLLNGSSSCLPPLNQKNFIIYVYTPQVYAHTTAAKHNSLILFALRAEIHFCWVCGGDIGVANTAEAACKHIRENIKQTQKLMGG